MKAYSLDLRERIVAAYEEGKDSQPQIAERFQVSASMVHRLLKLYRESGSCEPRAHGGGASAKLTSAQLLQVAQMIEADNDATLEELCKQVVAKLEVKVSRATMGRITQRLNLTRKKRLSTPVNARPNEFKS
jgi:transposase